MKPLLIAHRGDTTNFPENTMEAFASAFEKGADGVELDVQLFNGELIVVHDFQFDRTKTYPSLETVLAEFGQKGRLEIDIKAFSTEILEPLRLLLEKYQPKDIELTSTELPMVLPIKQALWNYNVGAIFNPDHKSDWMTEETLIQKTVELMQTMQADVAHLSCIPAKELPPKLVETLHANNLKVHMHIPKLELSEQVAMYHFLGELEVDQCTFDDMTLVSAKDR